MDNRRTEQTCKHKGYLFGQQIHQSTLLTCTHTIIHTYTNIYIHMWAILKFYLCGLPKNLSASVCSNCVAYWPIYKVLIYVGLDEGHSPLAIAFKILLLGWSWHMLGSSLKSISKLCCSWSHAAASEQAQCESSCLSIPLGSVFCCTCMQLHLTLVSKHFKTILKHIYSDQNFRSEQMQRLREVLKCIVINVFIHTVHPVMHATLASS